MRVEVHAYFRILVWANELKGQEEINRGWKLLVIQKVLGSLPPEAYQASSPEGVVQHLQVHNLLAEGHRDPSLSDKRC
mgnify:CR=1 FL=1